MIGDQNDMATRIKAVLPARWFPDVTPILDALLSGLGQAASWAYSLLGYAKLQTRIATATNGWLDLVAQDCFGTLLVRELGETDASLRSRIFLELLRPRATRAALAKQIQDITGSPGWMFEPSRPADTGCWGGLLSYGGPGAGGAGGWGNLGLPFQTFVVAHRPHSGGVPSVACYGGGPGGYGQGAIEYADASVTGTGKDAEILAAIAGIMPACAIAWTRIAP
jgi:hypothetical protein